MISNKLFLILSSFLVISGYFQGSSGQSKVYPVNEEKYKNLKETICPIVQKVAEIQSKNGTEDWSDVMNKTDIYQLAFFTWGYEITADSFLPFDLGWIKTVIDRIAYIALTTCSSDAISGPYLTAVKNLFQYYIYRISKVPHSFYPHRVADAVAWQLMINALTDCAKGVQPIELGDDCGLVDGYRHKNSSSFVPVETVKELYDDEFGNGSHRGLDLIIDSIWWIFSTAFARCYSFLNPHSDYILHLFDTFRIDILTYFHTRWRTAGYLTAHFGLIFGNVNATEQNENLRRCSNAAFAYEGILEQHPIRPVEIVHGFERRANIKIKS